MKTGFMILGIFLILIIVLTITLIMLPKLEPVEEKVYQGPVSEIPEQCYYYNLSNPGQIFVKDCYGTNFQEVKDG